MPLRLYVPAELIVTVLPDAVAPLPLTLIDVPFNVIATTSALFQV